MPVCGKHLLVHICAQKRFSKITSLKAFFCGSWLYFLPLAHKQQEHKVAIYASRPICPKSYRKGHWHAHACHWNKLWIPQVEVCIALNCGGVERTNGADLGGIIAMEAHIRARVVLDLEELAFVCVSHIAGALTWRKPNRCSISGIRPERRQIIACRFFSCLIHLNGALAGLC